MTVVVPAPEDPVTAMIGCLIDTAALLPASCLFDGHYDDGPVITE
jgi:hypothetical protein